MWTTLHNTHAFSITVSDTSVAPRQNTRNTPTGATEALTCLPPLDLEVQGEVVSTAHRPWSLGCWSYFHPFRGHSSILTWLQNSDPIFNTRVDVMRPGFNLEPRYTIAMFTRQEWTRGTWTLPAVNSLNLELNPICHLLA